MSNYKTGQYNFDEIIIRNGTDSIKHDFKEAYFGTDDLIPAWVADMDFRTPDFIVDAIKKRAAHEVYGYSLRSSSFFDAVIGWFNERHKWRIQKNHIIYTPGVVPALALAIYAYSQPGDKIIIQPPVYFPFASLVKNNGRQLVENPLRLQNGRLEIDFDHLESIMDHRVKMLFLCSPHNPGGTVWKNEELERLGEICCKHNVLIVSDEIHCDLVFSPHQHIPTASLSDAVAQQTITCVAASKTFNIAGLAASVVIIENTRLRNEFKKVLDNIHIGLGNVFGNVAMEAAYKHGSNWLDQLLSYLSGNINFLIDYCERYIPQIKPIRPEGTYLVWLDCRALGLSDKKLKNFMINDAHVGLNHGADFGTGGSGFQRINIACPQTILTNALKQIRIGVEGIG